MTQNGAHKGFDPGYFPIEQYNFGGSGGITGLISQQERLIIFSRRSIGRAAPRKAEGMNLIAMDYASVSEALGCDRPLSTGEIKGRAVFTSAREGNFFALGSTSAAGENEIIPLGNKILPVLRQFLTENEDIRAFNFGSRLGLFAAGQAFIYDFFLPGGGWFFWEGIDARGFMRDGFGTYILTEEGGIAELADGLYTDFASPVSRRLRLPAVSIGARFFIPSALSLCLAPGSACRIKYLFTGGERIEPREIKARESRDFEGDYILVNPNIKKTGFFSAEIYTEDEESDAGIISASVSVRALEEYR